MRVDEFLSRLDGVRRTSRGWGARCTAHPDVNPSLSIAEGDGGKILLRCWAGCTPQEIVSAMGLHLSDLFADAPLNSHHRLTFIPRPPRFDWRRESSDLLHRAEELELRADYVRTHACELDCKDWTDQDIETAFEVIARADRDERMAGIFRDVAFNVRALCLAPKGEGL